MNNNLTVKDIVRVTNGELINGSRDTVCDNFTRDTREIIKNDTYIGIKGERVDGNQFYEEAIKKGAICLVLENVEIPNKILKRYPDVAIILVKDTIKALQQIAEYKRSLYNIPVVAITGSVGKTSTKDIIASVLSQKYEVLKTQGNYNNNIGLPLTVLKLRDHTALVVELGMSSLGEISVITKIAKPSIAVITNVGTAHIGNLGSRENILKAKLEILEGLQDDGTLVINNDNDMLHNWNLKQKENIKIETYGIQNKSDIMAEQVLLNENYSTFVTKVDNNEYNVEMRIPGEHFVYNSLCAISVGRLLDIEMNKIMEGLLDFELTKGRMETVTTKKGIFLIKDCYNANYDSMKAAIGALSKLTNKKKIAVLGDMLELGEYSEELHKKVGEEVNKSSTDILITVGKEAENIARIVENKTVYQCDSNKEAEKILKKILEKGDAVLVKASNGMRFTEICEFIEKL